MTVWRYLNKRLHNPGSNKALCSVPLPPPVLGGADDNDNDDVDWVARGLSSSGDGSIMALKLRWLSMLLSPSVGERGGGGQQGGS